MYPVPGFPGYSVDVDGNVYGIRGRIIKPFYKDAKRNRQKYQLRDRINVSAARLILSAKLGRQLQPYEDACHINGDPLDNRMCNLRASDRVNNILDEYEIGRLQTTEEYIDLAIKRLKALKKMTKISEPYSRRGRVADTPRAPFDSSD